MKNHLLIMLITVILMLLSSCTVMVPLEQSVPINTKSNDKVLLDGEEIEIIDNVIVLERDRKPHQLTIQRDGHLDESITVMQYRRLPWTRFPLVINLIGYGYLIRTLSNSGSDEMNRDLLISSAIIGAGAASRLRGKKRFSYTELIEIPDEFTKVDYNKEVFKDIKLSRVGLDLNADDIEYYGFPYYKRYVQSPNNEKYKYNISFADIEMEDTDFSYALNTVLKERGYSDTLRTIVKNRHQNSLILDAEVVKYTLYKVRNNGNTGMNEGLIKVELDIIWKAFNSYDEEISEEKISSKSGEFIIVDTSAEIPVTRIAIKDAMEHSLMTLLSSKKLNDKLNDYSNEDEKKVVKNINLEKSNKYVSNLNEAISSSVTIKRSDGHGSGFIISQNGMILTNYHVIANEESNLKVALNSGEIKEVKVLEVSKELDIALLKIEGNNYLPFSFIESESNDFEIGQDVYAVGTPSAEELSQSVSEGIISGLRKIPDTERRLIQTDASINTGNSGGALVDKQGKVYGIVAAKLYGIGIEGVGFAIPIQDALKAVGIKY